MSSLSPSPTAPANSLATPIDTSLERRNLGAFYTPPALARYTVSEALREVRRPFPKVLDPACGDGQLLAAVVAELQQRNVGDVSARVRIVEECVFGADRDPLACEAARRRLEQVVLSPPTSAAETGQVRRALRRNIVCGDALLETQLLDRLAGSGFDVAVANPPFVNIRRLGKSYTRDQIDTLRRQYATATGNFDLYVLFVEFALRRLQSGGRAAFITPNKLATLDYAEACRRQLLTETRIESVLDATAVKWFDGADVYPYVWVVEKQTASATDAIRVRSLSETYATDSAINGETWTESAIRQHDLSSSGFVLQDDLPVERRVATLPLRQWGSLHSGASGFTAQRWLDHLVEAGGLEPVETGASWDFIVSGNIDRYVIRLGNVRYLKRRFQRPRLLPTCRLTERKRRLYDGSKIVVAGMGKRLEAALDRNGLALGVQVYALAEFGDEGEYLTGLLNSKLLSFLFRSRFAAKRLSGGYLAINKGQLGQLPIVQPKREPLVGIRNRLVQAVRARQQCGSDAMRRWDRVIDRLTYRLYGLSAEEIRRVERAIPDLPAA